MFEIKELWQRDLHAAVNPKSLKVIGQDVYITERSNKLSKININSGKTVWSQTVPNAWGWTSISSGYVYYMSQGQGLLCFGADSGELQWHRKFNQNYLGYIEVSGDILVTGGWRGYSNLAAYDRLTGEQLWSRAEQSQNGIGISVPEFIDNKRILVIRDSAIAAQVIDPNTGELIAEMNLPAGIEPIDLGRPYRILNGVVTFFTRDGKLVLLDTQELTVSVEDLGIASALKGIPYYFSDKVIFQDSENSYSMFDRSKRQMLWSVTMPHNKWTETLATQLSDDVFVIAGALGNIKMISINGHVEAPFQLEKRITTQIHNTGHQLIYGTKGSLKSVGY